MIVVGIKTWEQEEYLYDAVLSAINIADEIIIAFGSRDTQSTHDPKETTALIAKLIAENPGKIAVIRGNWKTGAEAMNAMWQLASEGDYFIRLEGNEIIPEGFVDELNDRLLDIVESNLPLYAKTLYFWKDVKHTIHTPVLDKLQFRGRMVNHRLKIMIPEDFPNPSMKNIKMKSNILSYKYITNKYVGKNYTIEPYSE